MVDNHAARTSKQAPQPGEKRGWISKALILAVFVGIIAALVLLT